MFLKSLTLKGFKSFADPTTLEFERGVTVVVGPNGSGKSNVVDAVAWVLGAQGPRTVRSAKMEDVIFAGTPKRPALGRAEVSLTIDNSAGLLPIEFSEVKITRTLFRNGDSEYAINGVPCRLLDIQELLSDSGVGRQQHVIVSQGQLDAVLNARPEERRMVVEEAAGVLKYRRRREKAQRRLESIEGDVQRLVDLLGEVRRQLKPLERQASAARRHDGLVAELEGLRRYLAGREIGALEARLGAGAQQRDQLAGAEAALSRSAGTLEAQVSAAEAEIAAARHRSEQADLAEALSRAVGLRQRAMGLLALLVERYRSLERELSASADRGLIASLESEAARLGEELVTVNTESSLLVPEAAELAEAEAALAADTQAFEAEWGEPTTEPGSDQSEPSDVAAEVRGELTARRASIERSGGELGRVETRLAALDQRMGRLRAEAADLQAEITRSDALRDPLGTVLRQASQRLEAAEAGLVHADEAWRDAEADQHRWTARSEALALALDEARARAGAERLAEINGFVGTLLEMVEVDVGWEAAFEAAAGEAVAAVIVDDVESARRSLDHLRAQDLTGAVLAMTLVPDSTDGAGAAGAGSVGPPAGPDGPVGPGGATVERLRDHVRSRVPGAGALLDRLLSHAVLVRGDWASAVDFVATRPDLVVVTADGDRFAASGWRTGAQGSGVTGVALDEARKKGAAAAATAAAAAERHATAKQEAVAARSARSEAARAADTNEASWQAATEARARGELALEEAGTERLAQAALRSETIERLAREQARVDELTEMLPALEQAAAVEAGRLAAERSARARLGERSSAVAALRREFEVRAAGLEERRTLLSRRLGEVEERLRRDVAQREEASERRERLTQAATATARLSALIEAKVTETDVVVAGLRAARQTEAREIDEAIGRLDRLRREHSSGQRQLAELRERAVQMELDEAEARVRLENLQEMVRRELDCEPDAVRGTECPPLPDGAGAGERAKILERELRQMGPINPLALEEYTALSERHGFIAGQLEDVRAAKRELTKVVRAVDEEIVEVFRSAFADVAANFEKLFATLFPGGEGRLRLSDPDQLLDTGIEVEARPSGKNVRRLSLLSGGERSLTALAFLFAVFRSRPSPFYLMDEVEAALDDVNLHRFLDLLHEFRDEAQLVVVSHQRRTMEAADCLYGVTMQPGGSSRVVSERVERATATA